MSDDRSIRANSKANRETWGAARAVIAPDSPFRSPLRIGYTACHKALADGCRWTSPMFRANATASASSFRRGERTLSCTFPPSGRNFDLRTQTNRKRLRNPFAISVAVSARECWTAGLPDRQESTRSDSGSGRLRRKDLVLQHPARSQGDGERPGSATCSLSAKGMPGQLARAQAHRAGFLANASTSVAALVGCPGFPRKPRSLNQSTYRSVHVPNGMPARAVSPPPWLPFP